MIHKSKNSQFGHKNDCKKLSWTKFQKKTYHYDLYLTRKVEFVYLFQKFTCNFQEEKLIKNLLM